MPEEQPRRKQRIPLSPEELHYFIKLKKLKEVKKLEQFKATSFYKVFNSLNIILAALVTYCVLSILMLTSWQKTYIRDYAFTLGTLVPENDQYTISEIHLETMTGNEFTIKTDYLFIEPTAYQPVFLGRDYLFNKIIKAKLSYDNRAFWSINAYASLSVCLFAVAIGFYIYKYNLHLTVNGLLTAFGLFALASLYFILI
jgi:hypothetical protein